MSKQTVSAILAADVATGGTFTVSYPTGTDRGSFIGGVRHRLSAIGKVFDAPENMTLSFGATTVTVTYQGATTLVAGTPITFEFDRQGSFNPEVDTLYGSGIEISVPCPERLINLGAPPVGASNSIWTSAALTTAAGATAPAGGALVANGVATLLARTGRNVIAAWTATAILTVTGKDIYGQTMVENSASGTSFTGKKAFKKVISISVNADVTGLTVGDGNVLGLPCYFPGTALANVVKELENGAVASAGTVVGGLTLATKPTATTADNRGTYAPNSTPDNSKTFTLLCMLPDPTFLGAAQFAG